MTKKNKTKKTFKPLDLTSDGFPKTTHASRQSNSPNTGDCSLDSQRSSSKANDSSIEGTHNPQLDESNDTTSSAVTSNSGKALAAEGRPYQHRVVGGAHERRHNKLETNNLSGFDNLSVSESVGAQEKIDSFDPRAKKGNERVRNQGNHYRQDNKHNQSSDYRPPSRRGDYDSHEREVKQQASGLGEVSVNKKSYSAVSKVSVRPEQSFKNQPSTTKSPNNIVESNAEWFNTSEGTANTYSNESKCWDDNTKDSQNITCVEHEEMSQENISPNLSWGPESVSSGGLNANAEVFMPSSNKYKSETSECPIQNVNQPENENLDPRKSSEQQPQKEQNTVVDQEYNQDDFNRAPVKSNRGWENSQTKIGTDDSSKSKFSDIQRKAHSLGPERSAYDQNWRHKDDTSYKYDQSNKKRYNEGSDFKTKDNTSFGKSYGDPRVTRQGRELFDRTFENVDKEYKQFHEERRHKKDVDFQRVQEIQQDLFAMPKEYSLAHCVAEDMRMGSGIAVNFKRDFKDLDVLLNQRQKQGGLAVLKQEERYIYYLVTKRVSNGKPTYETLWESLKKMRDHVKEYHVAKLAIPRLGCGLDRLEWSTVKHMIEFLFKNVDVDITVCNFQQSDDLPERPQNYTCKVVNVKKSIADIEEETSIIYLSSEDGDVSAEMEQLSKKFSFLGEFKRAPKKLGVLIKYKDPKRFFILNGCIVRKTKKDPFDFESFFKCVQQINRDCRKEKYVYVAMQAIKDDHDDMINDKIVTILKNYLNNIEVYICWDGDLVQQMPPTARE